MKQISVIESPFNLGLIMPQPGHEPGVKKLPAWLKEFGFYERLNPANVSVAEPPPYSGAVNLDTGVRNTDEITSYMYVQEKLLNEHLDAGFFVVAIGGDCSILIGNMFALKKRGLYGLFYLDGHTDFVLPTLSTTAGAAGMDLALIAGLGHEQLTNQQNRKPYVQEKHIWCVGNREYDKEYLKPILDSEVHYFDLNRIRRTGAAAIAESFLQMANVEQLDGFWIHFDVDVLNNLIMPAVDSPADDGLSYLELKNILHPLLKDSRACGIQITILDPELDPGGKFTRAFVDAIAEILLSARSRKED